MSTKNTTQTFSKIIRNKRKKVFDHKGSLLWLTGLSGSGKSTIAYAIEEYLYESGYQVIVLDGDNLRQGLCNDLSFTLNDRAENIRRVAEVSKMLVSIGVIVIAAFVSPIKKERKKIRNLFSNEKFYEIYCAAPIETCIKRDPKGLYLKAKNGEIKNFTGVNSPYEPPIDPELVLNTHDLSIKECLSKVVQFLKEKYYIQSNK